MHQYPSVVAAYPLLTLTRTHPDGGPVAARRPRPRPANHLVTLEPLESRVLLSVSPQALQSATPPLSNTVDTTFANGGSADLGFTAEAVAVQGDGKLVVAGLMGGSPAGGNEAVIERLNADGSPDPTFGPSGNGTVIDSAAPGEGFYGVTLQPDGKVIASGTANGQFLLIRYTPAGSPDPAFGSAGRVTTSLSGSAGNTGSVSGIAYSVALEPGSDGGIDVGGNAGSQFAAAGYAADGTPDAGFNHGTPVQLSTTPAAAPAGGAGSTGDVLGQIVVQSDGKVVGVGATADGHVFLARLNGDGSPDPTFDAARPAPGVLVLSGLTAQAFPSGTPDVTEGLTVDPSGNLLVANRTAAGHFGTVRVKPDGTPDATFGAAGLAAGLASTDFGGSDDADFVAVQGDGRVLVVGTTTSATGTARTALAAYKPDGTPDPTFGTAGTEVYDTGLPAAASPAATASDSRSGAAAPGAEGLGEIILKIVAAEQADGRLVVGASQVMKSAPTAGTANASTIRRLITTPATLPAGTLAATVTGNLPATAVAGARVHSPVSVTVTAPPAQAISGNVTVTLYVSQAGSLSGAAQVATVRRKVNLRPGLRRKFVFRVKDLPSVAAGSYFLLAGVTAPDGTTTGAAASSQVAIEPASVLLTPTRLKAPASARRGRPTSAILTLEDTGNTAAAGTVVVNLTAAGQAAGAAPQAVASVPVKVRLRPNAPRAVRVRFALPASLPAGSYTLTATLDVSRLGSAATAAGSAVSRAVAVA